MESAQGIETVSLIGKKIILGVTGGIAAYKAAEICRLLVRARADVRVVMTAAAQQFVAPLTFQALSGKPVLTSLWDAGSGDGMEHIHLSRDADLLLVAPASADFLAKLANGRADDLLTTLCLARTCGLAAAPAMNPEMWGAAATQRNLEQLGTDGVRLLGPAAGDMACGETGLGRMLEPADVLAALSGMLGAGPLAGRRVLVTAGPTFEAIDPVRGLTNRSSGKMGFAIARAAQEAGADVTLVAGPVHLPTPRHVRRIDVSSAQQMHDAVLPLAAQQHVFVATAAVADWRPASYAQRKIKKDGSRTAPALELAENPDILAAVARLPQPPYCVGFAAESENLAVNAREKLARKKVPLIVGNIGPATFGRDDNTLLLVDARGERELANGDKLSLARELVREISTRLSA